MPASLKRASSAPARAAPPAPRAGRAASSPPPRRPSSARPAPPRAAEGPAAPAAPATPATPATPPAADATGRFGNDLSHLAEFLNKDLPELFTARGIDASAYDPDVSFEDPLTRHSSIRGYLFNIAFLKRAFAPRFTLLEARQTGAWELTTRWAMEMAVQGLWRPRLAFTGTSTMSVNPATGRFCRHVDTWDAIRDQGFLSLEGVAHMFSQVAALNPPPAGLEQPPAALLLKRKGYEVRRYAPFAVAEAPGGDSEAFGALAGYLFGANAAGERMEMTAPVFSAPAAAEPGGGGGQRMQFFLGGGAAAAGAPAPRDARVRVREAPGGVFAVAAFSGFALAGEVERRAAELRAALARDGLRARPGFSLARYNAPLTPGPLRRNEVLVELEGFELPPL
jgi:hypothetical protein